MPDSPEPEPLTAPLNLFTREDFAKVDLNGFLDLHRSADEYELSTAMWQEAHVAAEAGDGPRERVFKLLTDLMALHLRVDGGVPFGPRRTDKHNRTLIASDIRGEQTEVIAEIAPSISHPLLRARLSDIAFTNSPKHHAAGRTAITAYSEVALERINGNIMRRASGLELGYTDIVGPIRRAIGLMRRVYKRNEIPPELREAFQRAWDTAVSKKLYVPFVELAEAAMPAAMIDPDTVATAAEALALSVPDEDYPLAVKRVWIMAAQCHSKLGRNADRDRCAIAAAEQTLRMRDQCAGSGAKASWTVDAIVEFRQIKSEKERVKALQVELRHLQAGAQDEMMSFSVPLDLTEEAEHTTGVFQRLGLSEGIAHMVLLTKPPNLQDLRRKVLEQASSGSIIETLFGTKVELDAEGKVIARVTAPGIDQEPDEKWMKDACVRHMEFERIGRVGGFIEPARQIFMDRFSIEERHLGPIIACAEFVPPGHEDLFARGFALMFQGDYAAAAHLLFPQLENSLRHILVLRNAEPSKIEDDLIQGDRTLSMLLVSNRAELEDIWGEDTIHDIEILFSFRPGPALRNELAHGKMTTGHFYSPSAIYACWFIFRLTFITAFPHWRTFIAPAIEKEL